MTLADEAQLYLAVVEVFRAEGHEPHWQPEWLVPPVQRPRSTPAKPLRLDRNKQRRK
ncbi:MAG TPA: hypothetical protein VIZ29_04140 [Gaiellaceae bacterium]|jgi:hypothetical protein